MRLTVGFFDHLHFTESFLGPMEWSGSTLIVPVSALIACDGHPLANEPQPLSGRLIFHDVAASERRIYEYVGDPRSGLGFEPSCLVDDPAPCEAGPEMEEFLFGGISSDRRAWIDWRIVAARFELETS